ncbi:hypothetical protein [Nitrosomonas sp. Nm51]|uniref:hypothetical protein n=1 Tax=Nitrosomonas sp. Nm51 TaxID=133720 RepID=UPI00115FF4E3|nr:hypothetical protein [Nitrosomonas sp. Nm51]
MSHGTGYGDDEQHRSVPARCDPSVTVIYERLLSIESLVEVSNVKAIDGAMDFDFVCESGQR